MDNEQPAGSESIESRLSAVLAPEAAPAEETRTPVAEDEATNVIEDSGEPAEQSESPADDWIEVQDDAGNPHKIPSALKDAFERRADYTRKTMAASQLTKAAEDRMQYMEAREQFSKAVSQHVAQLEGMRSQLKQLEATDTSQWDIQSALQLRDRRDDLRRQVDQGDQQMRQAEGSLQGLAQQHSAKQWQMAVEGAIQRIGAYTPGEDAAMLKLVNNLGFSENELKGRFADARFLTMAHKAAKWDTLQAAKPKEAANKAPPVLKPGASKGANVAAEQKYRDSRAQLKKSGSLQDAAKLFLMKG